MHAARSTTTVLGAMGLLVAGAMAALPVQAAAPATCQGKPVTVVGNGTEHDDVLVIDWEPDVAYLGKGGDDLICIRSAPREEIYGIAVDAGPGDDTVVNEVTDDDVWVTTTLGSGSDTYYGMDRAIPDDPRASPFHETVFAGERDLTRAGLGETLDTEPDTIDTGAGEDVVHSGSTAPGATNDDTVRLGPGDDTLYWGGEQSAARPGVVDVGTGADLLEVEPGWRGTTVVFDGGAKVATTDGRPVLRWSGDVHRYTLLLDHADVSFVGSDADESVSMAAPATSNPGAVRTGRRSAWMGAGDDALGVAVWGTGTLDGGPGRDSFSSSSCLRADVRMGSTFRCTPSDESSTYSFGFDRWEDLFVVAGDVKVVGTPGPDKVKVKAARARVRGLGGDDVLNANRGYGPASIVPSVVVAGGGGDDRVVGSWARDRLLGGRGDDKLFGESAGDVILGGRGRDRAFGQHGRDRCVAEVRRSCER
jgi:Ca2+-binding RTX toxin-like protein